MAIKPEVIIIVHICTFVLQILMPSLASSTRLIKWDVQHLSEDFFFVLTKPAVSQICSASCHALIWRNTIMKRKEKKKKGSSTSLPSVVTVEEDGSDGGGC